MTAHESLLPLRDQAAEWAEIHHFDLPQNGSWNITADTKHAAKCPGCIVGALLKGIETAERNVQSIIDLAESGNIPTITSGLNHNASHAKAALRALRGKDE